MYDIQNALRRRALAERLEALSRAAEATRRAADVPEASSPHPRHLAEPSAGAPPRGVTPLEPEPRRTEPSAVLDRPRGETLVVGAPDQTTLLEVPAARVDSSVPPPMRGADLPVPAGVTLLRDSLDLVRREAPAIEDDDLTVIDDAQLVAADQAPAEATVDATVEAPAEAPDAGAADPDVVIDLTDATDAPDDTTDVPDDDPPRGGSTASAIADLLRHGSSGLFFQN